MNIDNIQSYLLDLQQRICVMLEGEEGEKTFKQDSWQRAEGGGGLSCVLEGGEVLEKAGINFSHVTGSALPKSASAHRPELAGRSFEALGVSVVIHPKNPYSPTSHMNVRFFKADKAGEEPVWWFGGGYDLTPYYGFEADCRDWHQTAKMACEPFGGYVYPRYKKWCDEYFYLKHRKEPRGIGGLFFDDLNEWGFDRCFDFQRAIGDSFIKAYQPILRQRKTTPYSDHERQFQLYRRGRYAEFNLLYDRGTLFGLQSGGRVESILMSLPPLTAWVYDYLPPQGSDEEKLNKSYLCAREWI